MHTGVNYNKHHYRGFTIVELLVVIVVIGILAAITLVSYTGISSRATVASMQSDLSNAATKLELYQTENGTVPTNITDAINAKLISPSPSMDYYSYNVDNVSNPQYFCYMYRKGTDVYAVDSNSTVSKGVCLSNQALNGSFEDLNSIESGWNSTGGGVTITKDTNYHIDGIQSQKVVTTNIYIGIYSPVTPINSRIYYLSMWYKCDDSVQIGSANMGLGSLFSSSSSFIRASQVVTIPTTSAGKIGLKPVNGGTLYIDGVVIMDLTAVFGAGNEPAKAQMDTIMTQFPNSWFNATMKATL